eukprot:Colp12_sorted_trinity150504_noHs@85
MTGTAEHRRPRLHSHLTGVDKVFIDLESPENLMTISGLWFFDNPLNITEVKRLLQLMVDSAPRLRQVVDEKGKRWQEFPSFKLEDHLTKIVLDDPETFEDKVSELSSTPLDFKFPLWHVHLIEGLEDNASALLFRMHHCITDGQGGVMLFLNLLESQTGQKFLQANAKSIPESSEVTGPTTKKRSDRGWWDQFVQIVVSLLLFIFGILLLNWNWLCIAVYRKRAFVGRFQKNKRVAWSKPISLDDVKTVKNEFGATVNDVMVSVLAQTFKRFIETTNREKETELLTYIPVSLRKAGDTKLANRSMMVSLWLPVDKKNIDDAIKVVKTRMSRLKKSPEADVGMFSMNKIVVRLPFQHILPIFRYFMGKITAVITNVPGPADQLSFAGEKITNYVPLIPQPGEGGLGIAILSYGGKVTVSVLTDESLLGTDGPKLLMRMFEEEFDKVLITALERKEQREKKTK